MGMTTFALFRLFSSLETADEAESLFGGSILGNRPLLIATGISVLTIILATELGFLQRFLGTMSLTMDQWVICIAVSLSIIVLEEVRKLLKIRTGDEPVAVPSDAGRRRRPDPHLTNRTTAARGGRRTTRGVSRRGEEEGPQGRQGPWASEDESALQPPRRRGRLAPRCAARTTRPRCANCMASSSRCRNG